MGDLGEAHMRYEIYTSNTPNAVDAAEEIIRQISFEPATILFFAPNDGFTYYTKALKEQYLYAEVFGVTATTVFTAKNTEDDALTVCVMDDGVECHGGILEEISRYPDKYKQRITDCANRLTGLSNTVCLEFTAAFYGCEELVLDTLNTALAPYRIPVAGGSTGIKGDACLNLVSYNGVVYEEAAIFLLMHNKNGRICLFREDIFYPTKTSFYATDVNIQKRMVSEFDERPAADVLAEALGVSKEKLSERLLFHPLGRKSGGDIYMTDGNEILPDGSITFYASVYGNTRMVLMNLGDYRTIMQDTIKRIRREVPRPRLSMMINCYSRTQLFRREDFVEEFRTAYEELFGNKFFCFTGFGEQLYGAHLNQTLLMLVFE